MRRPNLPGGMSPEKSRNLDGERQHQRYNRPSRRHRQWRSGETSRLCHLCVAVRRAVRRVRNRAVPVAKANISVACRNAARRLMPVYVATAEAGRGGAIEKWRPMADDEINTQASREAEIGDERIAARNCREGEKAARGMP